MKVMLVYPNVSRAHTPQMGILSLGSYLLSKGIDVMVCDMTFIPSNRYLNHLFVNIREEKPDIVGFSCRTMEFPLVKELIIEVRKAYKNILLLAGGPHVTFSPPELAPYADYTVMGEGELAVAEIVEELSKGNRKAIDEMQNVCYLRNGNLVKNSLRPLLDLSTLPLPRYDLFDSHHYSSNFCLSIVPASQVCGVFEGSRGCPFRCTYCSNEILMKIYAGKGKWRREKPAHQLRTEIDSFKSRFGLDMMYFIDEVIMTSDERTLELKENMQDLGIPFVFMERPEFINEVRVKHMKAAGAFSCSIGIESANQEYRERVLKRKISDDTIKRAFDLMKKNGIKTHTFIMMGLLDQTKEIMLETYRLLEDIQPDSAQATTFFPLPGTSLYAEVKAKNLFEEGAYPTSYYSSSFLKYNIEHKRYIDTLSHIINLELWKESSFNRVLEKLCFSFPAIAGVLYKGKIAYESIKHIGFWQTTWKVMSKLYHRESA